MKKYDVFIFAGEASGDLHGKEIIEKLQKKYANISIFGVTGPNMEKMKVDPILKIEDFSVMGFKDVFFSLFKLAKNFFFLRKKILKENPSLLIFIDYPTFNLKLQKSLRKKGYKGKIIQYISPTVWAWKKNRIQTMKKNIDHLYCIYPFEVDLLKKHLSTSYVKNPVYKKVMDFKKNSIKNTDPIENNVGLFPGSRIKEIKNNFPHMLFAIDFLSKKKSDYRFFISYVDNKSLKLMYHLLNVKKYNHLREKIEFIPSKETYKMMIKIDFALATSGTINLELALFKIPTIVIYHISKIDFFIAKNIFKINLPFYCIVNILTKKFIFPELYGPNLTRENLIFYLKQMDLKEKKSNIPKICHFEKDNIRNNCQNVIDIFQNAKEDNFFEFLKFIR